MGKKEGRIEDYLINQAKKNNFLCYKFTSPSQKGVPDRIIIGNGRTVFIECKAEDGKLSELQKRIIDRINAAGGDARTVYSKDDIDAFFEEAKLW